MADTSGNTFDVVTGSGSEMEGELVIGRTALCELTFAVHFRRVNHSSSLGIEVD